MLENLQFCNLAEIQKLLQRPSKENGMEAIGRWRKACVRHFYWAVTSTKEKLGEVIVAKYKASQYHIINKHNNLPDKLFNKCAHGELSGEKLWTTKGTLCLINTTPAIIYDHFALILYIHGSN